MAKFWIELPSEICLKLERDAVEFKAQGRFSPKHHGKKALAEFLLSAWAKGKLVSKSEKNEFLEEMKRPHVTRPAHKAPRPAE